MTFRPSFAYGLLVKTNRKGLKIRVRQFFIMEAIEGQSNLKLKATDHIFNLSLVNNEQIKDFLSISQTADGCAYVR